MQESLFHNESLPVRRRSKDVDKKELSKKTETFEHLGDNDGHSFGKTTSYVETLLHLLKSNIGPGSVNLNINCNYVVKYCFKFQFALRWAMHLKTVEHKYLLF